MLRSALALAVLATVAHAQLPADVPICVYRCAVQKIGEGYCSNQSVFVRALNQCMVDHCNVADRLTGLQFADSICALAQNAGITSGLPASATESANNAISSAVAAAASTISSQDPSSLSASVASETAAAATVSSAASSQATSGGSATATSSGAAASQSAGGSGQNSTQYAAGALAALQGAGLTGLAGALTQAAPTQLLSELQQGNHTVFAPDNAAISALGQANASTLVPLLSYHVLQGQADVNSLQPGQHAILRSSLRGEPYVNLPGNQSQVVVLSKSENGTLQVVETARNISASGNATYQNLQLEVINPALTIPQSLGETLGSVSDLSTLASTANSLSPELVSQLGNISGITIFAPVNSAFSAAAQALGGANQSTIQAVLLNHIVNGTALYSTLLAESNATSAGGQPFTFTTNSTGTFVTSGPATAQVLQSDIIVQNGVVHTINGVLANTASNPQAAAAAASSAAEEGAKQTGTQTGAVTPQETGNSGGSGTSSGSAPSASASNSGAFAISAPVVTVGGVLFGGFALALLA